MKITSASKKVLCSALSAAMIVAFAPTVAFAGSATSQQANSVASVASADGKSVLYYDTLGEALDNAGEGDTVTLLADVKKDSTAKVDTLGTVNGIKGGVIFVGGGYTVSTDDEELTISVAGGTEKAQTSVTDVTFKSTNKSGGAVKLDLDSTDQESDDPTVDDADDYVNLSGVTADNIEVKTNDETTYATIAETTVTDTLTTAEETTVKSGTYAVVDANGKTSIADGTYESVVANADVKLTIKGGTFTGGMDDEQKYLYALDVEEDDNDEDATSVAVKGGTFTGFVRNANKVWDADPSDSVKIYTINDTAYIYDETAESADKQYTEATALDSDDYATSAGGAALGAGQQAIKNPSKGIIVDGKTGTEATNVSAYAYLGTIGKVVLTGGTFSSDPTKIGVLGTNVVCTQSDDKTTWTVGSGVDASAGASVANDEDSNLAIGEAPATKALAAAASAWLAEVKELKLPADLALAKNGGGYYTLADLYTGVSNDGAMATLRTAALTTYKDVKDVTAASSEELQAAKAEYDAIEAAAAAASLTAVVDQKAADLAADKNLKAYTQFYKVSATFGSATAPTPTPMADASTLGEGNEVTLYVSTNNITDYSDNNAYSIVYADGTAVAGQVVTVNANNSKSLGVANGTYVAFKTAKMGTFALAYTDTFADTKAEVEELQAELDAAKAELEQAKKDSEAAAAAAAAQVAALQDQVAAASVAGKTKTVTLGAKKTKTAKAKSVTLAAVASASGATMTFAKASGSAKITVTKAGKVKLAKGVKRGTYKATVTAAVGTALKNVTVKFVIQ